MKMRIKIEPAKNSSLYQIYSPTGFEFSISAKGIFETGLSTEKEIEESCLEQARAYAAREKVLRQAIYYLGFRDYSVGEMLDKLARQGIDGSDAVDQLVRMGYINDDTYADRIIEKYGSRYGKRRVAQELQKRKIDRLIWQEKLEQLQTNPVEEIIQTLQKRVKGLPIEDLREKQKQYAYFLRRGYDGEDIKKAIALYNENVKEDVE